MKSSFANIMLLLALVASLFLGLSWLDVPCRSGCNVVLIMADTLSANHVATYGYSRDTLPKTTAFFEEGIIFDDASSNATWTLPSFNSMYFSDLASNITYAELESRSRDTLQTELRAHNVQVRYVKPRGENFVFDTVSRVYEKDEIVPHVPDVSLLDIGKQELTRLSGSGKPFFLLVHIFDAHDPYAPKEPYNELFERTDEYPSITSLDLFDANQKSKQDPEQMEVYRLRYDQQLTQTDDYLVKFLKAIPAETLKNTVVILASDHGTAFGEHDKVRHGNNRLFQEEMHIPLMMRIPGVSPRRIVEPVSLLDMTPTILSLMRIPVSKTFIGESLIPLIDGESFGERTIPAVTGMTFFLPQPVKKQPPKNLEEAGALGADRSIIIPRAFGVRKGKTKLFEVVDPKEYAGFYWYDLETDPGEENNLAKNTENQLPRDLVQAIEKLKVSVKPQ